jgi:hypothetical protein
MFIGICDSKQEDKCFSPDGNISVLYFLPMSLKIKPVAQPALVLLVYLYLLG